MSGFKKAKCIICRCVNTDTVMYVNTVDEILAPGYYKIDARGASVADGFPPVVMGSSFSAYLEVADTNCRNSNLKSDAIGQTLTFTDSKGHTAVYHRSCSWVKGTCLWSDWEAAVEDAATKVWGIGSHINYYTEQGAFNICGKRVNADDGLPISNSKVGQMISAKLFVLDSSINDNEVCITQLLVLSNGSAANGNTYIRTAKTDDKKVLHSNDTVAWSPWGRYQQNIDVGIVRSFDKLTENGFYSGVHIDGSAFLLVVVNNCELAADKGQIGSICQYKYAVGLDGTFSYKARVGRGNSGNNSAFWGEWGIINSNEIDSKVENAIIETSEAINTELSTINGRVTALSSGLKFSLSVYPSVVYKGVDTFITIEGNLTDNNGAVDADSIIISTPKGEFTGNNAASYSETMEMSIDGNSQQFSAQAEYNGLKLSAKASVQARYPIYVGTGTSAGDIAVDSNKLSARTSASGTYSKTTTADGQCFILLVPSDIAGPSKFTMGGSDFAMHTVASQTINNVSYKVYRSQVAYGNGTVLSVKVE